MKKLFVVLFVVLSSTTHAQVAKDAAVLEYIKAQKDFVALTDTAHLPGDVKPYYKAILDYLSNHKMDKNDYYISIKGIQHGWETMTVPIYHYNGFKVMKELEDKNREANKSRKEGDPVIVTDLNGNASGMDGNLTISRISGQVIGFSLWQ